MKVLLSGGNGFLGRFLAEALSEYKHEVIAVARDKLKVKTDKDLFRNPHLSWYYADLSEKITIRDEIEAIVHTAGRVPKNKVSIREYIADNVLVTKNLIDLAVQKKSKMFISLSAVSVYGQASSPWIDETTPVAPDTPYGITKYLGELLLREKAGEIPSIILRLPTVVGEGMRSGWIFYIAESLRKGELVQIYNGDSPYNMVHVLDVAELVLRSIQHHLPGYNVFTVSCKEFLSIRKIVSTLKRYSNSKSEIRETQNKKIGFTISSEKAKDILGFQPRSGNEILEKFLKGFVLSES